MRLMRYLLLVIAVLMLASCKIRIIVPAGGSVTTSSGAYTCASGKTCDIDVVDFYFDQTFLAMPATGYTFKYWSDAESRWCPKDTKPCRLLTTLFIGDWVPAILPWLESDTVTYLQPVFEKTGASACYNSTISSPRPFLGNRGELVELSDGTFWAVGFEYNYLYEYFATATVCPNLGYMTVNGVEVDVTRTDCYNTSISSPAPFLGNSGEIVKLSDGTSWKVGFEYNYLYAFYAATIACPSLGFIKVNGVEIDVSRIAR